MKGAVPHHLLIALFLVILVLPPVFQIIFELNGGQPQVFHIFEQSPTPENFRAYENELQETSVTARYLRPWVQAFQFFAFRDGGAKALLGRDGWLFYQPGVNVLTQRRAPRDPSPADATKAIVDFRDHLADRGIRLILMPTPNKESIYPEKLSPFAEAPTRILSRETRALLDQCRAAGIEMVDLFALYREARQSSAEPLYLRQDSHWSPRGMSLAAAAVAELIRDYGKTNFDCKAAPVRRHGDIVRMLRSPEIEKRIPPEAIDCLQVRRANTNDPYTDDPASEILVLGDSFLRIYQQDEPGYAGFIAHLARELHRPVASIVHDGGASTLVRQQLFRQPELLANKKVVVWEFVERDLRLGTEGWQLVPLPPKS